MTKSGHYIFVISFLLPLTVSKRFIYYLCKPKNLIQTIIGNPSLTTKRRRRCIKWASMKNKDFKNRHIHKLSIKLYIQYGKIWFLLLVLTLILWVRTDKQIILIIMIFLAIIATLSTPWLKDRKHNIYFPLIVHIYCPHKPAFNDL